MKPFIVIALGIITFTLILGVGSVILTKIGDNLLSTNSSLTSNQTILADNSSAQTLTSTPTSWTSATAKNRTWLECDGVNDLITIPYNLSISFWYKNSTTDWQHIVNSTSTYVNGTSGTPLLIPFYNAGTNYILCKTDATTFIDVDVDEIRVYNGTINSTTALEIYDAGR